MGGEDTTDDDEGENDSPEAGGAEAEGGNGAEGMVSSASAIAAQQKKTPASIPVSPSPKRGHAGRKKSGRGVEEDDPVANSEDKVVKILPNLIIVPPGGKPPAGTLNTAPVTVPKVLPKILPKPLYTGGSIGATSGMLPGGGGGGHLMATTAGGTHILPAGTKTNAVAAAAAAAVVQEDLSCHICSKGYVGW